MKLLFILFPCVWWFSWQ